MNRVGQTFRIASTTFLVIQRVEGVSDSELFGSNGHRVVSLVTGKRLLLSESYLFLLEKRGMRLT